MRGGVLRLPAALEVVDPVPFVPRPDAWAAMESAWADVGRGSRRVLTITGEAGIGKSRLVAEFVAATQAPVDGDHRAPVVLYGACPEEGLAPLGAVRDAFDCLGQRLGPERTALLAGRVPGLRRLGGRFAGADGGVAAALADVALVQDERLVLTRSVVDGLAALAEDGLVIVVVDDFHWADAATAALVDELCRGTVPAGILVMITARTEPSDVTAAARAVLAALRRRPGALRVPLHPLDRHGVRTFVAHAAGHEVHIGLERLVDALLEETAGNTFFVGELWRHLVETGAVVRPESRWRLGGPLDLRTSPSGVRDVVAGRLARLPDGSREAVEWAGVLGADFEVAVLADAMARPVSEVMALLEPAVAANLVAEVGPGRCRFAHQLVQRAAHDEQPMTRRHERHLAVARVLGGRPGPDAATAVALHLLAAVPLVTAAEAAAAAVRAASAATSAARHGEAAACLEAALAVGDDTPDRLPTLLAAAEAHMRAGDVASAQQRALEAHDLARRRGDGAMVVQAAFAFDEANWRAALPGRKSLAVLDEARAHVTDAERVRFDACRARALALSGADEEARVLGSEALQAARAGGDEDALRTAFTALLFTTWTPARAHELSAVAEEFATLAARAANPEWEVWAVDKLLYGAITLGDLGRARRLSQRHRVLAARVAQPLFLVLDLQARSLLATGEGRFTEAEQLAHRALELGANLSGRDASGGYGVQMFAIRREQGRLEEARPVVESMASDPRGIWRPALAVLYAELGMLDESSAVLDEIVSDRSVRIAVDSLESAALAYTVEAAVAVGAVQTVAALEARMLPASGTIVQAGSFLAAHGAVDRYLGMLAALRGDTGSATGRLSRAAALEDRAGMPVWRARTLMEHARVLRAAGPAHRGETVALARAALALAEPLGMARVVATCREWTAGETGPAGDTLPAVGVGTADGTPGASPGGCGPTSLVEALTDRELDVVALLATGRPNREIARMLYISEHTAANHVRAVLRKTGCANRTEAASWAHRHGLAGG